VANSTGRSEKVSCVLLRMTSSSAPPPGRPSALWLKILKSLTTEIGA